MKAKLHQSESVSDTIFKSLLPRERAPGAQSLMQAGAACWSVPSLPIKHAMHIQLSQNNPFNTHSFIGNIQITNEHKKSFEAHWKYSNLKKNNSERKPENYCLKNKPFTWSSAASAGQWVSECWQQSCYHCPPSWVPDGVLWYWTTWPFN